MKIPGLWILLLLLLNSAFARAQVIRLHSITEKRMGKSLISERPYTFDSPQMIDQRAKLLNTANFGGTYPKRIQIIDDYPATDSFINMPRADSVDLLFLGTFNLSDPAVKPFSSQELDSLYKWSIGGGKIIHGPQPNYLSQNLKMFINRWGYELTRQLPSTMIPTEVGKRTLIFSGWFGWLGEINQGGASQGYFSKIPPDAAVLAVNGSGKPTLVLDCKTLDLLIADMDAYTKHSFGSTGPDIINNQDRFLANSIVFMDQLQRPADPLIYTDNCELRTGGFYDYQWFYNNKPIPGADSSYLKPEKAGIYRVEARTVYGCPVSSISVNFVKPEKPALVDTVICKNEKVKFDAGLADSYLWSTGEKTRSIVLNHPGEYKVKLRSGDCIDSGSFTLSTLPVPSPDLGSGYHICEADSDMITLDAGKFKAYKWSPTGDTTRYYIVRKAEEHFVVVTDFNGCKGEAGTIIKSMCPSFLHIPNAFTPNADNLNDEFKVVLESPIEEFRMDIYNLWGEKIFTTTSAFEGWDGNYMGSPVSTGTYYYRIDYVGYTDKLTLFHKSLNGWVSLVR